MSSNHEYGTIVPDYMDENVSDKVIKIIQSYTEVVNRMVWRKIPETTGPGRQEKA
jgi:UDP-N-acetylglucosamine 2-epimerase (non-hydrolysing)